MADEPVSVGNHEDVYVDEFERNSVMRALNLDPRDFKKYQHQVERIIQWAKEHGAKDYMEIGNEVKQLANKVGSPKIGNNWAQHLSTYAYLEMQRNKLDKELQNFDINHGGTNEKTDTKGS